MITVGCFQWRSYIGVDADNPHASERSFQQRGKTTPHMSHSLRIPD
jgi:hypothetical protein